MVLFGAPFSFQPPSIHQLPPHEYHNAERREDDKDKCSLFPVSTTQKMNKPSWTLVRQSPTIESYHFGHQEPTEAHEQQYIDEIFHRTFQKVSDCRLTKAVVMYKSLFFWYCKNTTAPIDLTASPPLLLNLVSEVCHY